MYLYTIDFIVESIDNNMSQNGVCLYFNKESHYVFLKHRVKLMCGKFGICNMNAREIASATLLYVLGSGCANLLAALTGHSRLLPPAQSGVGGTLAYALTLLASSALR